MKARISLFIYNLKIPLGILDFKRYHIFCEIYNYFIHILTCLCDKIISNKLSSKLMAKM